MKIKIQIIADDEQEIKAMNNFLQKFSEVEVVAINNSVKDTFNCYLKYQPDIILLDIELSNEKVFDYLSIFSKKPQLIFISADINCAIKAIKAGAKDYLLKPLQEIEFSIAIQNAVNVCKQKNDSIHSLPIEKYIIENGQSIFYVSLKNIIYLKSINNYTEIHFDDGKSILTSKTLKHYSEFFTPEIFMRIHHSYLINLHHLRQIENQGDLKVVLTNDIVLPISSRKKNVIFNQLKKSTQV